MSRPSPRGRAPRVLHVQFSEPGLYPPIESGARILADDGWDVRFVALHARGQSRALKLAPHPRMATIYGGDLEHLSAATVARFTATLLYEIARERPDWLYVSDATATPAALVAHAVFGVPVVYHEHDSPGVPWSKFSRMCAGARAALSRRAALVVLPNAARGEILRTTTRTDRPILCVWNCVATEQALSSTKVERPGPMRLVYQGTLVPSRLPLGLIDAIARVDGVELHTCGYETESGIGWIATLAARATALGIGDRFIHHGAFPRAQMFEITRTAHVGLSLMPKVSDDINMQQMTGASNKPFDYLSQGLPLLVSDLPEWRSFFVEPGLARAVDPDDVESLTAAIAFYRHDPAARHAMGERGRLRTLEAWNYEAQFAPVKRAMEQGIREGVTSVSRGAVV